MSALNMMRQAPAMSAFATMNQMPHLQQFAGMMSPISMNMSSQVAPQMNSQMNIVQQVVPYTSNPVVQNFKSLVSQGLFNPNTLPLDALKAMDHQVTQMIHKKMNALEQGQAGQQAMPVGGGMMSDMPNMPNMPNMQDALMGIMNPMANSMQMGQDRLTARKQNITDILRNVAAEDARRGGF